MASLLSPACAFDHGDCLATAAKPTVQMRKYGGGFGGWGGGWGDDDGDDGDDEDGGGGAGGGGNRREGWGGGPATLFGDDSGGDGSLLPPVGGGDGGGGGGGGGASGETLGECSPGCSPMYVGDQICDRPCLTIECAFDAGDCGMDEALEQVRRSVAFQVRLCAVVCSRVFVISVYQHQCVF